MKYLRVIALSYVLIVAACTVKKDTTSVRSDSKSEIKILCFNMHIGNPPSKPKVIDLDAIARVINESKADVVALQEVDKNTVRSGGVDQAKVLAEKTGMNYHFFKAIDFSGGEYGVAILSRHPLKDIKTFPLPQVIVAENRVLGQVTLNIANRDIIFANTHLDATGRDDNRIAQMKYVMEQFQNSKLPVIIAGDFNSEPNSEPIKLLDQYFKRVCTQNCPFTFPETNPDRTIDYIATKNIPWPLLKYEVIEEQYASDHRPIAATFRIN